MMRRNEKFVLVLAVQVLAVSYFSLPRGSLAQQATKSATDDSADGAR